MPCSSHRWTEVALTNQNCTASVELKHLGRRCDELFIAFWTSDESRITLGCRLGVIPDSSDVPAAIDNTHTLNGPAFPWPKLKNGLWSKTHCKHCSRRLWITYQIDGQNVITHQIDGQNVLTLRWWVQFRFIRMVIADCTAARAMKQGLDVAEKAQNWSSWGVDGMRKFNFYKKSDFAIDPYSSLSAAPKPNCNRSQISIQYLRLIGWDWGVWDIPPHPNINQCLRGI